MKLPLPQFIAHLSAVKLRNIGIDVPVSARHYSRAKELTHKISKYIVINSGPHHSGPDWPLPQRQNLVHQLTQLGIPVIALGGSDAMPLEGTLAISGEDFHTSIAILSGASLYIGQDCGTSWLACAAEKLPKIILVDQTPGRAGLDSYKLCLTDQSITELPLNIRTEQILAATASMLSGNEIDAAKSIAM